MSEKEISVFVCLPLSEAVAVAYFLTHHNHMWPTITYGMHQSATEKITKAIQTARLLVNNDTCGNE